MKVSIIIPAYNEEKFLPRCLNSIFNARLPENYEIIVVNNASTDRTEKVARSFKNVKVISEFQKGITKAKQAGFNASSGDLLVFFDADTYIPCNWFEIALKEFKKNHDLVAISGPYHYENITKVARGAEWVYNRCIMPTGDFIWKYFFGQGGIFLLGGNFAVWRWALVAIGGFNTAIDFYGEDTNLSRRLAKIGEIKFTPKLFVYSSPRRFRSEGNLKTISKYVLNFFSEWIFKKPLHKVHEDIR
jgi:glycosyltransferase involved in cell wall biosynthesis